MNQLRGNNASNDGEIVNMSKFIEDDYFYKDDSKKPKVSFAPQGLSSGFKNEADPIDNYMDRRPEIGQPPSAMKRRPGDKRKSFITNVNLIDHISSA